MNDKLTKQITNLGHWFAARSALSISIVQQKLGLFHHQPFLREDKKKSKKNPYLSKEYLEPLVKHFSPQQPSKESSTEKSASEGQPIGKIYFDCKPSKPLQTRPYSIGMTYSFLGQFYPFSNFAFASILSPFE